MVDTLKMQALCEIAKEAGNQILEVYESDFDVETKEDQSPLTLADKKSHQVIVEGLKALDPNVPILSEEGKELSYEERKQWKYFWLVDPLDGTKEFVKRNGEFTVNIALVKDGKPIVGIIYAPVLDEMYIAKEGFGAHKVEKYSEVNLKSDEEVLGHGVKLPAMKNEGKIYAVASRSHMSEETELYVNQLKEEHGEVDIKSAGSSLKLCLVAEGKADVYPRFAPTMEWDTGAGQAIVEQSGGTVMRVEDGNTALDKIENGNDLVYNKGNLLNPWFIAKRADF